MRSLDETVYRSSFYVESFVCWATDPGGPGEDYPYGHEHPTGLDCDYGWVCSDCPARVDDKPCPDHAPTGAPGLRLVECQATPRHWLFAHNRDDYGHGCPWCWADRLAEELKPFKQAAVQRAHRWCRVWNPLKRMAIATRIARPSGYGSFDSTCRHVIIKWRRS